MRRFAPLTLMALVALANVLVFSTDDAEARCRKSRRSSCYSSCYTSYNYCGYNYNQCGYTSYDCGTSYGGGTSCYQPAQCGGCYGGGVVYGGGAVQGQSPVQGQYGGADYGSGQEAAPPAPIQQQQAPPAPAGT